jgi:hypothetical protein
MDHNTRIFYGEEDNDPQMGAFGNPVDAEYSNAYEVYTEEEYEEDAYEDEPYTVEDMEDEADGFAAPYGEEAYGAYEQGDEKRRFRVAMNVFDTVSVLMGLVVILALTALIVSMVSWLRTDILHSFVILQSGIQ